MMKTKLKFFLVFLAMMVGGVNSVWAGAVYFQKIVVELSTADLSSYLVTDPDNNTSCYMYQQDVYWVWYTGDTPMNLGDYAIYYNNELVSEHNNAQDKKDFEWTVKVNGNIDILCYSKKIDNSHNNDRYFLKVDDDATAYNATKYGSHIYFKASDNNTMHGTIEVTATNKDFGGQPYTCSYTIKINMNTKSTKWDFYSKHLTPTNSSVWVEETISGDDKLNAYNVEVTDATDLGTIISETAGLKFKAPKNSSIFSFGYKDPDPSGSTAIDDRYVGLYQGATLIIPKSTWSNHEANKTRIRIKMGRYGGTGIRLTIGNAKDALGNDIYEGTYEIGGSAWWGSKGDNHQRGEYHFIVANNGHETSDPDFTIKVEAGGGTWLKLYSIEVYESDDLITENSVLGDKYQLLNTGGTVGYSGTTGEYYLHYRGKAEGTKIDKDKISTSGNITTNDANRGFDCLEASSNEDLGSPKHKYTSKIGDFGTFGMQIACYTHGVTIGDKTYQYCTDYASRRQSVGYMATKEYPYTWDLKDIWDYKFIGDRMSAGYQGEGWYQDNGGLHLWAATNGLEEFGLRLALDAGHNVMYCGGSQLWYGKTIIPETAGLAFTPVNYDNFYDYALKLSSSGLTFDQTNRDWWGWRVTVPSVPVNGAVYIRAKNAGTDANMRHVKYYIGPDVNNKTNMIEFADASPANTYLVEGKTDEYIYAVYNNSGSTNDITFFFNEVEVQKIAVSTDKKTFNPKGWTTESREHDIDPSLTVEMNGRGIKTYLVTGVNDATKKVTTTDISNAGLMKLANDGDKYACILRNTEEAPLEIVNGGFYLFVPDMHDEQRGPSGEGYKLKSYASSMESSIMKAQVNPIGIEENDKNTIPETEVHDDGKTYTNFAFTFQYYDTGADGVVDPSSQYHDNAEQAFYRIAKGGAISAGHQGYLPLYLSDAVVSGSRKFTMSFDDETESDITIVEPVQNQRMKADVYYNLNGQQLNGQPSRQGLYIVNGKKMYVK